MPVWVKKCFVTSPQKWGEAEGMDGICKGTMFVQPWISKPAPPDLNCSFNPLDLILKRFFGWICTNFHPFVPLVGKSEWQTVQLLPIAFIKIQSEFAPNDNSSFAFLFFPPKSSSGTDQNLQSWAPCGLDANGDRDGYFQCDSQEFIEEQIRTCKLEHSFIHNLLAHQNSETNPADYVAK